MESNSTNPVYFDDMKVSLKQYPVIQKNDYYPMGMAAQSWSRPVSVKNSYLYNGGSELNETTGNYETFFRHYDPSLGRFNGVDIKAGQFFSESPYSFAGNSPILYNDPLGDSYLFEEDEGSSNDWLPGSGNYWTDGIDEDDWNSTSGSESYRRKKAYAALHGGYEKGGEFYDGSGRAVEYSNGKFYVWDQDLFVKSISYTENGVYHRNDYYGAWVAQNVGLDIIIYEDFSSGDRSGLTIKLGFNDMGTGHSNLRWVQTIRTNVPLKVV